MSIQKVHPGGQGLAIVLSCFKAETKDAPYNLVVGIIGNPFGEEFQDYVEIKHKPSVNETIVFKYCVNKAHDEVAYSKPEIERQFSSFLQYKKDAFVPLRPHEKRYQSEIIKLTCFAKGEFPSLQPLDIIRLNGLTMDVRFQVGEDMKSKKAVMDEEVMQKVAKVMMKQGECYISYDVKAISLFGKADRAFLEKAFSTESIKPLDRLPRFSNKELGNSVLYIDSLELQKKKDMKLVTTDVMVPFFIPTETLEARGFNELYFVYKVDNLAVITGKGVFLTDPSYPQLVSMNMPLCDTDVSYVSENESKTIDYIGGPDKTCMHRFINSEDNKDVVLGTRYYSRMLNRLGIYSHEVWMMAHDAIIRGLNAICTIRCDLSKEVFLEEASYVYFGVSDAIAIDYRKTYQVAGLRVSMQYALKNLHEQAANAALPVDELTSTATDPSAALLSSPQTNHLVKVFCLNTYKGKVPMNDEWRVYAIPPRLNFVSQPRVYNKDDPYKEDRDIIESQRYSERDIDDKTIIAENEKSTDLWFPVKIWRSSVVFMAVRKDIESTMKYEDIISMGTKAKKTTTVPTEQTSKTQNIEQPTIQNETTSNNELKHKNDDEAVMEAVMMAEEVESKKKSKKSKTHS